jgi:predicted ferric reductase
LAAMRRSEKLFELAFFDGLALPYLVTGIVLLTLGALSYAAFFNADYVNYTEHKYWTYNAGYDIWQFISLLLGTYFFPFGIICILIFAVQSFKYHKDYTKKTVIYAILAAVSAFSAIISYIQGSDILTCFIFCFGDGGVDSSKNNGTYVWIGVLYFIFSLAFMVLFAVLSVISYSKRNEVRPVYAPVFMTYENQPLLNNNGADTNFSYLKSESLVSKYTSAAPLFLVFGLLYPLLLLACMTLPTWWAYFTKYDIQQYQSFVPNKIYGSYIKFVISDSLVLKLYPDIVVYYSCIYVVAFIAWLTQHSGYLRRFMHRQYWFFCGLCIGETLLLCLLVITVISIYFYWYFAHSWELKADDRSEAEKAARSIGQIANLITGVLVLPVTRNSVWHRLFGISFDSMIKYHIYLGYSLLTTVACHVGLWWIVYSENDSFPHDILAIPQIYHKDNFTVPLAVITSILMFAIMGILSHHVVRRLCYELFYYSHHFALVIFLMMLWHSTMSWYYVTAGLSLWAVDHVLRLYNCIANQATIKLLKVVGSDDVIQIGYNIDNEKFSYLMSQYMYVNIPILSQLEWHPFTISSVPGDGLTTHHIKAISSDSWTGKLLSLAKTIQTTSQSHLNNIVINVDGPYGLPIDTSFYSNILLVAGGIGITPIHAVFKSLYQTQLNMGLSRHIKSIRLIWIVRTAHDANMFLDSIRTIIDNHYGNGKSADTMSGQFYKIFSAVLYVTNSLGGPRAQLDKLDSVVGNEDGNKSFSSSFDVRHGRPDLQKEIIAISPWGMQSLVYACGPASLVNDCVFYATKSVVDVKIESFQL